MKRTNVVLDEQLLEKARRMLGEKTYSGTITKALEKIVRQEKFWEAYRKFEAMAHSEEGFFDPAYLEEKRRKSLPVRQPRRVSTHDARAPKGKNRRGSR